MRLAPVLRSSVVLFTLTALSCSNDDLHGRPHQAETCDDGSAQVDGVCPTPDVVTGNIAGHVCDRAHGEWLPGVTATVTLDDGSVLSATTDNDGAFTLANVPIGGYYVHLEGAGYTNDFSAFVEADQTVEIGATSCATPGGTLRGRVCNYTTGLWVQGATVTLSDADSTSTTTDTFGRYEFDGIVPGSYTLTIASASYNDTRSATVQQDQATDIGPEECTAGGGGVHGRICGGEGYWLSGARVFVDLGGGAVVETTTDASGFYTLTGVPPGTHTVHVTRGAFSTSFSVTVGTGVTNVPDPVCIPPTTSVAVVTGQYDKVEEVLADLGFPTHQTFGAGGTTTQNPDGNVDIIAGNGTTYWLTNFLTDPVWMSQYDIIFFNCGIDDADLAVGGAQVTQALTNLKAFVHNGGSIYASDWASELMRQTFPGRINYLGAESYGAARTGAPNNSLAAQVLDGGLATALGRSAVTISFNLDSWAVVDTHTAQPADLRVLVRGNIEYGGFFGFGTSTLNDSPLVVQFSEGTGRVLFTSAHNETQNTPDLENILNYIVFEL